MNFKLSKTLQSYYFLSLFTALVAIGGGLYLYFVSGLANVQDMMSVFEVSSQIDYAKSKNEISRINMLLNDGKIREIAPVVDSLERESKRIDLIGQTGEKHSDLQQNFRNAKKDLNKLLSLPELHSVLEVFTTKMRKFEEFVVRNNWRTLTRMSRRIRTQMITKAVGDNDPFAYSKMNTFLKSVSRNIRGMKSITKGSVLSSQDKKIILLKLKALEVEVVMLDKYLSQLSLFRVDLKKLGTSYKAWLKFVAPEVSMQKIQFEKRSKVLTLSLLGLFSFLLIALLGGFLVSKNSLKTNQTMVEAMIVNAIKDGIIPFESKFKMNLSPDFFKQLDICKGHVHKRMSFGSVFQDAVPFASALFDSNLNMVWGNSSFYETWDIENYKQRVQQADSISWDYLQRFTNLGEDDPVISAIKENLAGIYQIQVRTVNSKESIPYELYVSPVEYGGQQRVMIFLYPLCFLEETISNQTKSLVGPISRTLDALINNTFNDEFRNKIKADFEIADTNEIYKKFSKYYELIAQQKFGLMREIESLENNLYDQYKLVDDLNVLLSEKSELQKDIQQRIKEAKNAVVSMVDLRSNLEGLYSRTIDTSKNLFKDELSLLTQTTQMSCLIDENIKAFSSVKEIKKQVRNSKAKVDEFKGRMIQTLNQAMIFDKTHGNDRRVATVVQNSKSGSVQAFDRIKMEIKGFEKVLSDFTKVLTGLDVGLSKIELILQKSVSSDFGEVKNRFDHARDSLESDTFNVNKMVRTGQVHDEEIIKIFKGLMETFTNSKDRLVSLEKLIVENKNSHNNSLLREENVQNQEKVMTT